MKRIIIAAMLLVSSSVFAASTCSLEAKREADNTIHNAQVKAKVIVNKANEKAARVVGNARFKAAMIVAGAKDKADEITASAKWDASNIIAGGRKEAYEITRTATLNAEIFSKNLSEDIAAGKEKLVLVFMK